MKKYNLSAIMKRAWELVKKAGMSISSGLKEAWKEVKDMCKELPELVGSPKQIAWAEDIRKKMIEYGNSLVEYHRVNSRVKRLEKVKGTVNILFTITEASWFINNREYAVEPRNPHDSLYAILSKERGYGCEDNFYKTLKYYDERKKNGEKIRW